MDFPELKPVELPASPDVSWAAWAIGIVLLAACMALAVLATRRTLRRRTKLPPPMRDPAASALQALASIPDDWPVERGAAAGARILRGYLSARGFGPGLAYPAREFSGLRAAEACRDLTGLLETMESLACRQHPSRAEWLDARDLAGRALRENQSSTERNGKS